MRDTASDPGASDPGAFNTAPFNTAPFNTEAIAADATALAGLPGGTGHEQVRIDWLHKRLAGVTRRDGWLCGPGIGDNAIAARASAAVEWRATDQAALDRQDAALAELLD